ncbi:MAG: CDP-diacylglycerol--glycerol-3-phosphate 3-phosphatidyltransferase [Phycisphaerae bacterium]|nr:CDP-diacylglycerol--glycerol-3-phosphate 3-phosphatidyltransferase [Phycisphaerae bacterium]
MSASLNLPNRITLARLVLAIVFFILLAQYNHREPNPWILDIATALFIVAAATDFLDGYLARSRGEVTPLGRVLDPFVDKVLICGAFIFFIGSNFVGVDGRNVTEMAPWMVVVIVGRELLVTGLRGFSESMGKSFAASLHGKIKMWMQSIAAPTVLLLVAHEQTWSAGEWATWVKRIVVWLTVLVTALSTLQYLARSREFLTQGQSR